MASTRPVRVPTGLRRRLLLRGWVVCDYRRCHKVIRPRWLAMRQGWKCAGIAGGFDTCSPEHETLLWEGI